ncbi:glycosyltransferase family 9 protein [Nitrospinota bacterium]
MGDTLVSVPVLWALRRKFPDARFEYISEKPVNSRVVPADDVLDLVPEVSRTFLYEMESPSGERLRQIRRFFSPGPGDTLVYLCYQRTSVSAVLRDWLFFRLAGFRRIMGIGGALTDAIRGDVPIPGESEYARLFRILDSAGMTLDPNVRASLRADGDWADCFWEECELNGSLVVAVCPGSKHQSTRWPAERYGEVLSMFSGHSGLAFVLIGGENDRPVAEKIITAANAKVVSAVGCTLLQTCAILSRADVYLGNDTGPMHLAALHGVPCVAVFSAFDRAGKWYPQGEGHTVLRKDLPCSFCLLEECFADPPVCLSAIEVDMVADALGEVLKKLRAAGELKAG